MWRELHAIEHLQRRAQRQRLERRWRGRRRWRSGCAAGVHGGQGPKESPACIADSFAVFVSPTGDDNAKGTKTAPVRSITKGVALAAANRQPHVYVCEESYDTNVEITTPLAVFGGVTCGWAPSETARPKLAPAKGIALRVTKVTGAVVIQDLGVVGSADASTPGDSAVAAFVSESDSVTFTKVSLRAGAGVGGDKGAGITNFLGATAAAG